MTFKSLILTDTDNLPGKPSDTQTRLSVHGGYGRNITIQATSFHLMGRECMSALHELSEKTEKYSRTPISIQYKTKKTQKHIYEKKAG